MHTLREYLNKTDFAFQTRPAPDRGGGDAEKNKKKKDP